jgi:hypothetical protein
MQVVLRSVGIVAPGLADWPSALPVLRGAEPYAEAPVAAPPPLGLAPNERRRASLATRLALAAARQATDGQEPRPDRLLSVFASADGDMTLIERMCNAIYREGTAPSPTVFQNSVHNAVGGYWAIATGCRQPSTSIAAGDGTFAAGLVEAAVQVTACRRPLLLMACDVPAPPILHPHRTFCCPFACALLLAPRESGGAGTLLSLSLGGQDDAAPVTALADPMLETIRTGNPAARALPLLAAVAVGKASNLILPYWPDLRLRVQVEPAP